MWAVSQGGLSVFDVADCWDKARDTAFSTSSSYQQPESPYGNGTLVKIDETDASGKKKSRIQAFEGLVMAIQGSGISKTFTVRKVSGNVGTEKTLPVNSPRIDMITVVRKGKVRRAKLNYIRKSSKTPKIKERV